MPVDLKPFVSALRKNDTKKAREWLEQNRANFTDEFGTGYFLALHGMASALETGAELPLIKRLVDGGYEGEQLAALLRETRARLSLKFRPKDEEGFDTAWVDVLQEFSEKKGVVTAAKNYSKP